MTRLRDRITQQLSFPAAIEEDPDGYRYSPLAPQQLRFLKPIYSLDPNDLRFEIRHISREAAQRYTAVSYTWGDQEPTKMIRLNGKLFHVRPNLLSCLYYLSKARHDADLGWDWIWVDAICINQQDDREKSEQVGLMDKTYSNAQMVSLWLGLSPSQEEPNNGDQGVAFEYEPFEWYDQLEEVLNRPYWSRFWVIQEFLLAREIHYHCSSNITNSEHLSKILTSESEAFSTDAVMNEDFHMLLDTAVKKYAAASLILARERDMSPKQDPGPSLYDLLIRHRHANCKDRRDRVFALLSLLGEQEHALLSRLLPNYALSAEQVAVIALAHMINHQSFERVEITIDSDDIFQALGQEGGRAVRKHMLARAKQFGYYDDWASLDVARTMALQELFVVTNPGIFDDNSDDFTDFIRRVDRHVVGSADGSSQRGPVLKSLGVIAFLAVTGALATRYLRTN
ncbi:hypothetical protein SLS64_007971 [Diaporthe eres]